MKKLRIATRESRLALWQAKYVQGQLQTRYPECSIELVPMTTRGDEILDRTLSKIGGKGLFIRELEQAMLDNLADIAVHSLKDMPMVLPEPFQLAVMMERENPYDVFVSNNYSTLASLPNGAKVGTASLRRTAMIYYHFPFLQVEVLRGNLDTRLRKLDEGQYDAIILAGAGLIRMENQSRISETLSTQQFLPSPGQGTVSIETRRDDNETMTMLKTLICHTTTIRCTAERAFAQVLEGGCEAPIAAFATIADDTLSLTGWVGSPDGKKAISHHQAITFNNTKSIQDAAKLGKDLADYFIDAGAKAIIDEARKD